MTGSEAAPESAAEEGARPWPALLGQAIGTQALIEANDPEGLLAGTVPAMPATEDQITAAERALGERLPAEYRQFLGFANGWRGCYFTLDVFGTAELQGEGAATHARELLETYDAEDVLEDSGLEADDVLPIGTSQGADLVLLVRENRPGAGTVVWIDGSEYGRYSGFNDFFDEVVAMLDRYARTESQTT
jgi:hypothetical protein